MTIKAMLTVLRIARPPKKWAFTAAFPRCLSDAPGSGRNAGKHQQEERAGMKYEKSLTELESSALHSITPNAMYIDSLALWLEGGKLNLTPKYQRGYVWKEDKASRLVVTALCSRIVPAITFHEVERGQFHVVDGKQRLSTLLGYFIAGKNPEMHRKMIEDGRLPTPFSTLSGLDENYDDLEGLSYQLLSPERQSAFSSFKIPVTTIPFKTPQEDVFSCYEDINSGGEDLTAQQIRRAAFYGEYIEMLDDLALNNADFQRIRDPHGSADGTYQPCPKDLDRELILRALAWERDAKGYQRPLKTFLNRELRFYSDLNPSARSPMLKARKEEFEFVMKVWGNVFSESGGAFRTWSRGKDGNWCFSKSISKPFWDLMYVVAIDLKAKFPRPVMYTRCKDKLQDEVKRLFEQEKLVLAGGVTAKKFAERKDLITKTLTVVLNEVEANPRQFPGSKEELSQQLFDKQTGKCGICDQTLDHGRILDADYAELDHIMPYSQGGKSTHDNAALVHFECNRNKGSKIL